MNDTVCAIHNALSAADLEYSGYSCNGVNLFGDKKSIDAAARAFHSHSQIDWYQTNLRHWREECGKLHAKLKAMELENLQLSSALTAIRDRIWRDGETYDERIGDLKWLAREALERKAPNHMKDLAVMPNEEAASTAGGGQVAAPACLPSLR